MKIQLGSYRFQQSVPINPYSFSVIIGTVYDNVDFSKFGKDVLEGASTRDIQRIPNSKHLGQKWEKLNNVDCYKVEYNQLQGDKTLRTIVWSLFYGKNHLMFQVSGRDTAEIDKDHYNEIVNEFYPIFQTVELY